MTVPDLSQLSEVSGWFSHDGLLLAIVAIALFIGYRLGRPAIHRFLVRIMKRQEGLVEGDPARIDEIERRAATVEDLLAKGLRIAVATTLVIMVLGLFDLWSVLAGLGLVLAAITLAGQDIVLDYLMGLLILLEGQYFKGDIVTINGIGGTVEEVGLRRTVLRDFSGVVHSISNGTIRTSSNMTRTYAVAVVLVEGIADRDQEAAIRVLEQVGEEIASDDQFAGVFIELPAYTGTTGLTALGATLRLSARVQPNARFRVEFELRRRVSKALAEHGIEPIRPIRAAGPRQ
jgi:moderate conductance mechanosensitive channel